MENHYKSHRSRFISLLEVPVILAGYTATQKSGDMAHEFLQESHFWWLSGIEEPDWQLIIEPGGKTWLVAPTISSSHQIFDGSLSTDDALKISGADGAIGKKEAAQLLHDFAKKHDTVYTFGPHPHKKHFDFVENPAPSKLRRQLKKIFTDVKDCRPVLSKLRAIKQPHEIEAIQQAINVTNKGFELIRKKLATGEIANEYEVEAEFTYLFKKSGNYNHAYDPIIASGKNACTLHYDKNNDRLGSGLLLMDVGARVHGYAADITRTLAVGDVTDRERQIHSAVQTAHNKIVALLEPGLSVEAYGTHVEQIMKDALDSVGLLKKPSDYRKYFPHAISHGLGVDVHDSLGAPEVFQPGMVLTVEPGIYIPEEGIGVRIEDDILITDTGHRNLSGDLTTEL